MSAIYSCSCIVPKRGQQCKPAKERSKTLSCARDGSTSRDGSNSRDRKNGRSTRNRSKSKQRRKKKRPKSTLDASSHQDSASDQDLKSETKPIGDSESPVAEHQVWSISVLTSLSGVNMDDSLKPVEIYRLDVDDLSMEDELYLTEGSNFKEVSDESTSRKLFDIKQSLINLTIF